MELVSHSCKNFPGMGFHNLELLTLRKHFSLLWQLAHLCPTACLPTLSLISSSIK